MHINLILMQIIAAHLNSNYNGNCTSYYNFWYSLYNYTYSVSNIIAVLLLFALHNRLCYSYIPVILIAKWNVCWNFL